MLSSSRALRRIGVISRPMSNFITVGDDDAFTKLEHSESKQVMYFTATWCPPCKLIGPVVEKMAPEYPGVQFLKVDVDQNPEAALKYAIRSVPTFLFAEDGDLTGPGVVGADEGGIRDELNKMTGN